MRWFTEIRDWNWNLLFSTYIWWLWELEMRKSTLSDDQDIFKWFSREALNLFFWYWLRHVTWEEEEIKESKSTQKERLTSRIILPHLSNHNQVNRSWKSRRNFENPYAWKQANNIKFIHVERTISHIEVMFKMATIYSTCK